MSPIESRALSVEESLVPFIRNIIALFLQHMAPKPIAISLIIPIAVAALLIVPWAALERSHAQSDLANTILEIHNRERAAVGVPPLVWSDKLAADAKPWAEHLATTPEFKHDPNRGDVGENIAGFNPSKGVSAPGEGQMLWVDEKKEYTGSRIKPLYANGLEEHERGRLRDRQWCWSSIQHSGVPLQPGGQRHRAEAVLGEQAHLETSYTCSWSRPNKSNDRFAYNTGSKRSKSTKK